MLHAPYGKRLDVFTAPCPLCDDALGLVERVAAPDDVVHVHRKQYAAERDGIGQRAEPPRGTLLPPERPGAALSHMIDADFASVLGDFGKRTLSAQSRAADAAQAAALEEAHRARQQLQKALQRQPAA